MLAGVSLRAKSAMAGVMATIQKRRADRAETAKANAPRRTTAAAPGGGLKTEGRRLVRDDNELEEDDVPAPPMRSNKRAAVIGGGLGLLAVLAVFAATRLAGSHHTAAAASDATPATTAAALMAGADAPGAASGTPTANVPLFGATPLSTTEPVPVNPAPSAVASAAPSADPGDVDGPGDDDGPGEGKSGPALKEWGQGTVGSHPIVLKIKMDGPLERLSGASGAMGFTITVPDRRSLSVSSELARKDKRLASVNVVNTSHGAEVTVQFKDGVPPYLAKAKGDRLEIALGSDGHGKKVAKKKKKSDAKPSKKKHAQ